MNSDGSGRWEVRAYPNDDPSFLAAAQTAVASSWDTVKDGRRVLEEVRTKLRAHYPACELRLQDELAQLSAVTTTVIYAFRDGRAA